MSNAVYYFCFVSFWASTVQENQNNLCGPVENSQFFGRFKKLVVFALFGYESSVPSWVLDGIRRNELARKLYYPDWVARYYVLAPGIDLINAIRSASGSSEIVRCWNIPPQATKAMRLLPYDDVQVARFISRDIDACLGPRELLAVNEWIVSDLPFHCMHDHPMHHEFPVLAGMFGMMGVSRQRHILGRGQTMEALLANAVARGDDWSNHFFDQRFIEKYLWPIVRNFSICHDIDQPRCKRFGTSVCAHFSPMVPRTNRFFVGSNLGQIGGDLCPHNCTINCVA